MGIDKLPSGSVPMQCPVCTETETTMLWQAYDDRYGQPDIFSLVRCTSCRHVMTSPRLQEKDLAALYSTYYPRKHVNVGDLKREALRCVAPFASFGRWWAGTDNQGQYAVQPGELMLDVGCGSGLSLLEARALGAEVRGVEADPNIRRIADELGLRIHIGSLLDEPFSGEQFDLVVLNQVIEHMPEPGLILDRLRSRLKPKGRIILVFPNIESIWCRLFGKRWINWHVPYHLHHFNRSGFVRMATRLGYQVKSVRTITPNLWTMLQIRASRIRVEQGKPSPVWSVLAQPSLSGQMASPSLKRGMSRIFRRIARRILLAVLLLLISLVNRLVDMIGWGDGLMVEIVSAETR
jgi:2-polyprenyl-3-methyl-5-hydroxy-6-metoxy-1,4-benzoquinol methylase